MKLACVFAALVALLAGAPAPVQVSQTPPPKAPPQKTLSLAFGVYQTDKATVMYRSFTPLIDALQTAMAQQLNRPVDIQLTIFRSYDDGIDALSKGTVDFVHFGPASYIVAKARNPGIELLAMESENGAKRFQGVVIVAKDSPIQNLQDLKGKTFAFGDPNSTIGRWLVQGQPRGLQTDMFAEAAGSAGMTRASEWLSLPPASDLSAKLSASAVQTYETCPLQFKLEREWKIPGEVPAAMQYGGVIHRVLLAFYDSVRAMRPMEDEAVIQYFNDELAAAGIQDRYQHDLYQAQGVLQLGDFLAAFRRAPAPQVLHTEEFFDVKVGEVRVVGRIDRIDRSADDDVIITDYKTGKAQSQEDSDESLQLSIYTLAAREKWGYRSDHLVLYNLEGNSPVVTRRNDFQLNEAKRRVTEVAGNIAAGKFEAKPGFYCRFCAYRNLCPATEKRLQEPALPNRAATTKPRGMAS